MNRKSLGLYIHIPFCEKKCDYCNFVSFCAKDEQMFEYVDLITKEIKMQAQSHKNYVVDSIFIGGGTPSFLKDGEIKRILDAISLNFSISNDVEITIECNPNSITENKLKEYKSCGINRISVGLQAYSNKLLKLIGRVHRKKDFNKAIDLIKKTGFKNINVDLILGLPKQKLCQVKQELKYLTTLDISHISAYGLIVEEGTKLAQNLRKKMYKLPKEETQVKMYDFAKKYLQKKGFFRYEVSNFSKQGFESKHNLKYWTGKEYLGLGLVSSSFENQTRWKNTEVFSEYKSSILSGVLPKREIEYIDKNSQIEECIMLELRLSQGIDLVNFKNKFGFDLLEAKQSQIEKLKQEKLIEIKNSHIYCTDLGFKLLNRVILELI